MQIARAREGDRDSLEFVVRRLTPLLMLQARYRLKAVARRVMDPEDLVSEAWLRALPKLRALEPRDGRLTPVVMAYLSTTVRRLAKDVIQAQLRRAPRVVADEPESVAWLPADTRDVVTRLVHEEASDALHQALGELSASDREIIVLRGLEQVSVRDAARLVGISEDAVKQRYHRAIQRLKDALPGSVIDDLFE